MDFISILLAVVLLIIASVFVLSIFDRKDPKLPPGPKGLPLLGNILNLRPDPPTKIAKWAKEFGSVMTVRLGLKDIIIISDYDIAKTVFGDDNTAGRDQNFIFNKFFHNLGLVASEGELWREHRRFTLATLRDLGMGKTWFEDTIIDEITDIAEMFKKANKEAVNPRRHLTLSVSNQICALTFGRRFKHTDSKFLRLSNLMGENLRIMQIITPVQYFPFLRYIPYSKVRKCWSEFFGNINDILKFSSGFVHEHKQKKRNPDEPEEKLDYIDSYFIESEKHKGPNSTFTESQLTMSLLNLFAAGTETTTTTLLWSLVFMIENPDVQQKVHEEIDEKIEHDRSIRMGDKPLLPYLDAVTLEVQRLGSVAPLGVMHSNFQPMKIGQYEIPARTLLSINSYAMHRDPKYWKHPEKFYPEHFLDKEGAVFIPKGFAPFGVGKRSCPGESLAKMEIYLFFANFMQKFRVVQAENNNVDSSRYHVSLIRTPAMFDLKFIPRN